MEAYVIEGGALPEWMRTTLVDDGGEMFLPCGAFADEGVSLLCLAFDGIPLARHEGHVYAPASWLAAEHPRYAHVAEAIVARVRAARNGGGRPEASTGAEERPAPGRGRPGRGPSAFKPVRGRTGPTHSTPTTGVRQAHRANAAQAAPRWRRSDDLGGTAQRYAGRERRRHGRRGWRRRQRSQSGAGWHGSDNLPGSGPEYGPERP